MSSLTNKQTKNRLKRFRFLEFGVISFVYREREEKDLRYTYDRHFEQILPTFCHGTKVKP